MASATGHNTNLRFLDVGEEPNQALLPIRGYAKEPLLPLEEAAQPISELLDDLETMVHTAKWNSKKPADGLTVDESAAIHLYTMQWEEPNVSLFTKLNTTLRSKRREPLKPWFRYLKLALTALFKLPSVKATVWRGVRGNLSDQYDEEHIWWGFSSCTESMKVMEQFVGTTGVRTLFNIECINGKAIQKHSFYKDESEVLLLPGTYFRVVGKWSPAKDLYMIQLRETPAPHVYLEPPFGTAAAAPPPPSKPVVLPQAPAKEEKSSSHASAAPAKTKYKQEFAVPSTDKQLDCYGRPCAECGKCRDWYFTGDRSTWNWIRDYRNWKDKDRKRYSDDRIYEQFRRRENATCGYLGGGGHYDLLHYYDLLGCLCEDNIKC